MDLSRVTTALTATMWITAGNEVSDGTNTLNWTNPVQNLSTGSGNDTINADNGANNLSGGSGNDIINANNGNDTVIGGSGNDTLDGGIGNDTFIFANAFGAESLADASGTDTLYFSALNAGVSFTAASGTAISGNDSLTWNTTTTTFEQMMGGIGNDTFTGGSANETLNGGAGNDTLTGGAGSNVYAFSNGWDIDVINSSSGLDTVDMSAVTANLNVTMWNTSGNEISDGINILSWTGAIENLTSGSGNDIINCDNGANSILSGAGNDVINANNGNDTLSGGAGNDTLAGGINNDTYLFKLGEGQDSIQENDSTAGNLDTVLWDSSIGKTSIAVFMVGNNLQIGYQGNSSDLITVQSQSTASGSVERFQVSDGTFMTNADVNAVIASMTTYATNNGISLTSLNDVKNNTGLMNIVAAGWHS